MVSSISWLTRVASCCLSILCARASGLSSLGGISALENGSSRSTIVCMVFECDLVDLGAVRVVIVQERGGSSQPELKWNITVSLTYYTEIPHFFMFLNRRQLRIGPIKPPCLVIGHISEFRIAAKLRLSMFHFFAGRNTICHNIIPDKITCDFWYIAYHTSHTVHQTLSDCPAPQASTSATRGYTTYYITLG